MEELLEYWVAQQNIKEKRKASGIDDTSSFRRIDEFEKSVEIYEQGKRSRKSSSDRKSSRSNSSMVKFENSIHLNQVSIDVDDVD